MLCSPWANEIAVACWKAERLSVVTCSQKVGVWSSISARRNSFLETLVFISLKVDKLYSPLVSPANAPLAQLDRASVYGTEG